MDAFGVDLSTVATLSTRPDRLAAFRAQRFGSVRECLQTKHPNGSMRGCFEAHRGMWELGETAGAGPQAVFEDDAQWTTAACNPNTVAQAAESVKRIMQLFPSWDIIGLGGMPMTWESGVLQTGIPGVIQAKFTEAHAYIISPSFRKRILDSQPYFGHVDVWLSMVAAQSFFLEPELIRQDPQCGTDNGNPVVGARDFYKSYAYKARTLCGRVPLRHVETLLLLVSALLVGLSYKGSPRVRVLAWTVLLIFVFVYLVDAGVLDFATKPRTLHV